VTIPDLICGPVISSWSPLVNFTTSTCGAPGGTVGCGDPHSTTCDGLHVTYQKCGDYDMIGDTAGIFVAQVRMCNRNWPVSTICGVGYKGPVTQFAIYTDASPIGQWYFTANGLSVSLSVGQTIQYSDMTVSLMTSSQVLVTAVTAGALSGAQFYTNLRSTIALLLRPAFNYLDEYYRLPATSFLNTTGLLCPSYDGDYTNDLAFRDGTIYSPSNIDTSRSIQTDSTVNAVQYSWASTTSVFNALSSKDGCPLDSPWGARRQLLAAASVSSTVVTPDATTFAEALLSCTSAGLPVDSAQADNCAFDVAVTGNAMTATALAQSARAQPVFVPIISDPSSINGEREALHGSTKRSVARLKKGGGQSLIFKGLFSATDPVREVLIGGLPHSISQSTSSQVVVISKASALSGPVDVVFITTSGVRAVSRQSVFILSPSISSVLPASGGRNTQVTILGALSSTTSGRGDVTKVWFGQVKATIAAQSDSSITVVLRGNIPRPFVGATVDVTVTSNSLGAVLLKGAFTFTA